MELTLLEVIEMNNYTGPWQQRNTIMFFLYLMLECTFETLTKTDMCLLSDLRDYHSDRSDFTII